MQLIALRLSSALVPLLAAGTAVYGIDVRDSLQSAVESARPGYEIGQAETGQLISGGAEEYVVLAHRAAESESEWPSYSVLVLSNDGSGFKVVAVGCPEQYNPSDGFEISVKNGSLFTREALGGMQLSVTTENQYRFDGNGFRLIGSERNRYHHRDDPTEEASRDVRFSMNLVTGATVEYTSNGQVETMGSVPKPSYLECKDDHASR